MLAIIDSNKFNYKNKIVEFKYTEIRDLVNNVRNNAISEISAKKGLNKLNEINAGIIKYKKCTPKQKELLNLFNDLLDVILTDETLKSKSQKDDNENDNDKILMSSNKDDDDDKTLMSSNEDDDENEDDETMDQNKKYIIIKWVNDVLDKLNDKSKLFEDQIKSTIKVENSGEYYFINNYDNKELKSKIFKLRLAHLSNIIDEKLFKQIFGHKFETLANKLIKTTNKEENQIIVNNNKKTKESLYEEDETSYDYVIQPGERRVDLLDGINLILNFNKTI